MVSRNLTKKLRIAIATTGRFHVLDLARELQELGHQIQFFSYVSKKRARRFGLYKNSCSTLRLEVFIFLVWQKLLPNFKQITRKKLFFKVLNNTVSRKLNPCDVFICMSGVYLESAEYAKREYGARIILERGSMHVDIQHQILLDAGALRESSHITREREVSGYLMADVIMLPSCHAKASFEHHAEVARKTFLNPYGVDLNMFPCKTSVSKGARFLYVGNWSLQKGVDVLVAAIEKINEATLTHVGAIVDYPFPDSSKFTHYEPVNQPRLSDFYREADVFIITSRQDGLSLVILQALASGLPVIASNRTGAETIKKQDERFSKYIRVHEAEDVPSIIRDSLTLISDLQTGVVGVIDQDLRLKLSWKEYGKRYEKKLNEISAIPGEYLS